MIDGVCKARNKHPEEDESKRLYYTPDIAAICAPV